MWWKKALLETLINCKATCVVLDNAIEEKPQNNWLIKIHVMRERVERETLDSMLI